MHANAKNLTTVRRPASGEQPLTRTSYLLQGTSRLVRLCRATGLEDQTESVLAMFSRLLAPWGDDLPGDVPSWPSEVGDDHTPYEFSAAFGDRTELRLLVEPLGSPPSLESNRDRALAVLADLAKDHPISMERLDKVRDLFLPEKPQGLFSLWLGVSFSPGAPDVKLYLNPEAQGPGRAAALIEEAMVRLGFPKGWHAISQYIGKRGRELDELKYFSLDVTPSETARVKVYARHLAATADDCEYAASVARSHKPGDVADFVRAMAPGSGGELQGRPPATCLAFVEGTDDKPAAVTHHFPVNGGYAENDAVVATRVHDYLVAKGTSPDAYDQCFQAIAERPLDAGIGLQSYASLRRDKKGMRLTAYFPLELFEPGKIARAAPRRAPSTPAEIVERFEAESLADHPFMRRIRREPVDLYKLWKLMANAQIGIVAGFSRRLAQVVARVTDERVRSILAHQLNDELGNGKYERAHSQLFGKLVMGLERWKPKTLDDALFAPGATLSDALEAIYRSDDPWEGVGATMVIEIFGRQVDQFFGDEFRRQMEVDPKSLEWLTMHEELEIDHSAESMDLAHMVPAAALPSVWRGAARVSRVSTEFFDGVYRVAF
jgi:DMATS type aromatic prenyltransferase